MISTNLKNLSSMYYNVNLFDINKKFKNIIEQSNSSVSGVGITVKQERIKFTLITPSFIRLSKYTSKSNNLPNLESSTLYEGYLYYPFFLPIYDNLDGEFIEQLESISNILNSTESIYMQWLFTKAFNWQDTAIDMYSSYILGNDDPLPFKVARKFQDGALRIFNKLASTKEIRDYIEDAERKIISEGFRFQLRVAIESSKNRQEYLVSKIEDLFNQYAYYNTIRLNKVQSKNFIQQMQDCIMTPDNKYQILSKREILSLFGGNDLVDVNEVVEVIDELDDVASAIELLPDYPMQEVGVDEDKVLHDIAEALKRVGITNQARVYKGTVTTGIRLTTIQASIPNGKNLTDITKKQKDIQAALGVESLSIEQGDEPDSVKFMIPNEQPAIVGLRSLLELESFKEFSRENKLSFVVGLSETNFPIFLSLANLPHLLVAGTTGSGKSVFINALAVTLQLTHSPQELNLIMIDPKMVEFQHYKNFPHVTKLITDMDEAEEVFEELTNEMDRRYEMFLKAGVNHIDIYNEKVLDGELGENVSLMSRQVVIVDEFADLKDTNPEVEKHIIRLGQKSRACGLHIVICTQRPSVDVVSNRLKSNVLNAISFNLGNSDNYRTVFGKNIPYNLLNKGDGVLKSTAISKEFQRFQSAILTINGREEEQIYKRLADYLNTKYKSTTNKDVIVVEEVEVESEDEQEDENLIKLKQIIATTGEVRTSELRKLMGIKNTTLSELMKQLVAENWLEQGRSKAEGYRLVASEEELEKWRNVE